MEAAHCPAENGNNWNGTRHSEWFKKQVCDIFAMSNLNSSYDSNFNKKWNKMEGMKIDRSRKRRQHDDPNEISKIDLFHKDPETEPMHVFVIGTISK